MVKFFWGLSFSSLFLLGALHAAPAHVTVDNAKRQILIDGQPFEMRGVAYSPTRAGGRPPAYDVFVDSQSYIGDLKLMQIMGANTVRTFDARRATTQFLDEAQARGLRVVMSYPISTSYDPTGAATQTAIQAGFLQMVNAHKDHPAVLMWALGNEVAFANSNVQSNKAAWYGFLNTAAAAAKSADPHHPVTTVEADITDIGISSHSTLGADPSNVDLWGVNFYRGAGFQNAFSLFSATSAKPLWIGEFGWDAYNAVAEAEDESGQASGLRSQWQAIDAALSAKSRGPVVGACVFEWSDEWWKGAATPGNLGTGGSGGDAAQDVDADWTNNAYTDPTMNEEWWGITAISTVSASKRLREGFYALRDIWNPVGGANSVVFMGEVSNFPNPLVLPGSTQIRMTLAGRPDSVKVDLYDASRRKVTGLPASDLGGNVFSATWNGLDENGEPVAPGVYICRVEVTSQNRADIKYRKIAVVR